MEVNTHSYLVPGVPVREAGIPPPPPDLSRAALRSSPMGALWPPLATVGAVAVLLLAPAPQAAAPSADPSPSMFADSHAHPLRKLFIVPARRAPPAKPDAPPALENIRLRPFEETAAEAAATLQVILSHRAEIAGCVAEQRDEAPEAEGRLVMRWEILPDGTTADISSETPEWEDSALSTCMVGLIREWTFPPSAEERSPVTLPIRF